jgi:hypothetical protein
MPPIKSLKKICNIPAPTLHQPNLCLTSNPHFDLGVSTAKVLEPLQTLLFQNLALCSVRLNMLQTGKQQQQIWLRLTMLVIPLEIKLVQEARDAEEGEVDFEFGYVPDGEFCCAFAVSAIQAEELGALVSPSQVQNLVVGEQAGCFVVHLAACEQQREIFFTVDAKIFTATTKCDLLAHKLVDLVAELGR